MFSSTNGMIVLTLTILSLGSRPTPAAVTTEQETKEATAGQANGGSSEPAISADGRFVAFSSSASNLVPDDTNFAQDIFVRDRRTGTTTRVSVGRHGLQSNKGSFGPAISVSGRFIAFTSEATNLVAGDTNEALDVFVHDRRTRITTRVSVGHHGLQADGQSVGEGMSADGKIVVFESLAANLVQRDTNSTDDIFVYNRATNATTRVSVGRHGVQGNFGGRFSTISANGRYILFWSSSTNLVPGPIESALDVYVRDRATRNTTRVGIGRFDDPGGRSVSAATISNDGRFVAFPSESAELVRGDTNRVQDIFVRDRKTCMVTRVSVGPRGVQADGISYSAAISANGRFVTFASGAANLVTEEDTNSLPDIFIRNLKTNINKRVSVNSDGNQANGENFQEAISADGRFVVFTSLATNLISRDTNSAEDVFLHDTLTNRTERVSVGTRQKN